MLVWGKCYLVYVQHFKHFIQLKHGALGDFLSSAKQKCALFQSFLKTFKIKSITEMSRKVSQGRINLHSKSKCKIHPSLKYIIYVNLCIS